MKKHKKYRILGVTILLLAVISLSFTAPTYAEETTTNENGENETTLTCTDLAEKYGIYIESGTGANEYVVIRDAALACGDTASADVPLQVIAINGVAQTNGPKLEGSNTKITVEANLMTVGQMEYMSVTFKNLNNENETLEVRYEVESLDSSGNTLSQEANTNYNGICATFRAEVAAMDTESQNYYKETLSYCWKTTVPTGTNYTESEVQTKIDRAKANWSSFTSSSTAVSTTFLQEFNRIKANAQKLGNTYNSKSAIPNSANAIQLKCKYNYLPTSGATYTNAYGETINENGDIVQADGTVISDGDDTYAYLNKDYYYATNTETTGSIVYTYNYAPGNTKTVTQSNVCKRTCEESVKVEYGPPVASKAGLCFEYQVKVTSYVKCASEFTGTPPSQTTSYCSPGVKCKSPSGVERSKPQAGPTTEYETCIYECDGGEYSQECSVKCYNEVYADTEDTKIKLALNYEDAKAVKLANTSSSSYSLEQCQADNASYGGCYYYEGSTIKWGRSIAYNKCSRSSAGRWYQETGYGSICTWSGGRQYIVDSDGFLRGDYGGSLCNDTCSWKTDCGTNVYLNPGTIAGDYRSNMEEYEAARASCAGAATCTTSTADFTIAIKYDTSKETSGTTTTTINKVYFPYSTVVENPVEDNDEYSSLPKATLNANGTVSNDSIILSKGGCYTDRTVGNKYMTEWSFPGTYIHNKTGEIAFKVPEDTSGWYYENDKFCMPLNAKSVNTKWWEWYKLGNTCYTNAEIEAELAGKTGTSNGYNIEAITNTFGYFGWNFEVSCFYGLRNEICDVDENTQCCKKTTCEGEECDTTGAISYMVRTVDRQDIFPNTGAEDSESGNIREIGFNWTDGASISTYKNSSYVVDPLALIQSIQTNANQLYSDDATYLDYQFYLTPSTLRQIREYNTKYDYGEWMGVVQEKNGINTYISNLWNSVGTESSYNLQNISGAVIKTGEPGVNNERWSAAIE